MTSCLKTRKNSKMLRREDKRKTKNIERRMRKLRDNTMRESDSRRNKKRRTSMRDNKRKKTSLISFNKNQRRLMICGITLNSIE